MSEPDLVYFSDFGGDWASYEDALYDIFRNEVAQGLTFRGERVSCRRLPETASRWASFWHLIQEGRVEADRTPDLRRCERLRWVRWVIEEVDQNGDIDWWENWRGTEMNVLLWFREEYLVILARRSGYWLLKTAYCTSQSGRCASLRKERDQFHQDRKSQNG